MFISQVAQKLIHTHFFHFNILRFCLLSPINNCINTTILHRLSATVIIHNLLIPPVNTSCHRGNNVWIKHPSQSSRTPMATQLEAAEPGSPYEINTNVHTYPLRHVSNMSPTIPQHKIFLEGLHCSQYPEYLVKFKINLPL